ncbi:thioredoxin peroxidase DOT5 [Aspergillus saccharolyticus JOP 1030-1]|uniref:thioredoxin-dependent peroxiredoxin n=1 Tax=Aspergillus saccharolyticus JOP 1030-1 TaxID=1450539 RepID=A0A318YZV1_9EURO|nr:AhpC-TSA-domain-containing protein [Aspergillus saccharolyticus JOP 1030-1]PYH40515.1 AhpC-TSA-domain-containing protein [Aspergillus saccharolyticus JOP 1030-1]
MVELRKRKAPAQPLKTEQKSKRVQKSSPASRRVPKIVNADSSRAGASDGFHLEIPKPGEKLDLNQFGGEFESHDGTKVRLKDLVDSSKAGVVLFTYPRASTPGCTRQACLFRDSYESLTATGLSIYGLSADSPKANTTFKVKQKLPYTLLCNPSYTLIEALGFKKMPKGTKRGVFAINKQGKVLLLQTGGPDATYEAAQQIVATSGKADQENA